MLQSPGRHCPVCRTPRHSLRARSSVVSAPRQPWPLKVRSNECKKSVHSGSLDSCMCHRSIGIQPTEYGDAGAICNCRAPKQPLPHPNHVAHGRTYHANARAAPDGYPRRRRPSPRLQPSLRVRPGGVAFGLPRDWKCRPCLLQNRRLRPLPHATGSVAGTIPGVRGAER